MLKQSKTDNNPIFIVNKLFMSVLTGSPVLGKHHGVSHIIKSLIGAKYISCAIRCLFKEKNTLPFLSAVMTVSVQRGGDSSESVWGLPYSNWV